MTITQKFDKPNSCPNYCTYVLLWLSQNHTRTFRLGVYRGFCEHEKISGQTEEIQHGGKLSSYLWGKICMQTSKHQSRSREAWWLNINCKIYKEIRRTTESHWKLSGTVNSRRKAWFVSFFLPLCKTSYSALFSPFRIYLNLTLDSVPNRMRTFRQGLLWVLCTISSKKKKTTRGEGHKQCIMHLITTHLVTHYL